MKVEPIDKQTCDRWVAQKHYTRKPCIFWFGFGLIIDGMLEGVCVYGQPSPQIQKHAFADRDFRMLELGRLVVQTNKKNAASFLVGNSLKMLPSPCAVVSYADTAQGHAGIVYQATNWLYTGQVLSHDKHYLVDGVKVHPMTLRDRGITAPAAWARANGIEAVSPMPKHRYFFLVGTRSERKIMAGKLRYDIVGQYPKAKKQMYDSGPIISERISKQPSLF